MSRYIIAEGASEIKSILSKSFPLAKVKDDFFQYLELLLGKRNEQGLYVVWAYDESNPDIPYEVQIEIEEIVTLLEFHCRLLCWDHFDYMLIVGFGEFRDRKNVSQSYKVGKCLGKLHYNHDLTLSTVDFFISDYYRLK